MRTLMALAVTAAVALVTACGARDDGFFGPLDGEGGIGLGNPTGGDGGGVPTPPAKSDRIDLLLTIDNSRSMSDKQEILSAAVPSLLDLFINPLCVDGDGVPLNNQPASPQADCPSGERMFPPVTDIHVGVITTSLGGHGSDSCEGDNDPTENDMGHLIARGPGGGAVQTYESLSFLAWDPLGKKQPPGTDDSIALVSSLKLLVLGAGQVGCGFEATHESWYRFLVEPNPHDNINIVNSVAELIGTDDVLLQQRRDFLRPDSLLAIVVLSDENDCSIRDGSQFYFAGQVFQPGGAQHYHLPKPRAACATNPNDPCCRSCGQASGDGCDESNDDCAGPLAAADDHVNLRCFDQKRRFGIDFLYPMERYSSGLTESIVADRHGNLVSNPIFSDLITSDDNKTVRDERLVFLTSVVGVPWQDIARQDGSGKPDLETGLDADGRAKGGFQTGAELSGNGTWDIILGDPTNYHSSPQALPDDPLMIESSTPRTGQHPITSESVAPPGAGTNANTINGHEYSIPLNNDLQYACVFDLLSPRDCTEPTVVACDCNDANNDNPLCQDAFNQFGTTQFRAKAYPGIRHLTLVKQLAERGVVGSICPAVLDDPNALGFGYMPTIRTLVESVAHVLDP
jgi:hypothetical protein